MKTVRGLLVVGIFIFLSKVSQAQSNELVKVPQNSKNGNPRGYIQYLPPNFDNTGNTKYSILYWLHGLGEIGIGTSTDLDKVFATQICQWLKSHPSEFIILVPQDYDGYWNGTPTRLKSFVDWANLEYGKFINPGQQHLAGLSAGGYGVRDFILENSDAYKAFSTFTLMSTNVNLLNAYAQRIIDNKQMVWFHHGSNDVAPNTVNDVKILHDRIYAIDTTRSRLTVYTGIGHSAWDNVYNGTGMMSDQRTGRISGTTYYEWTEKDIDKDWYGWMKASGKSSVKGDAPSVIRLNNFSIAENNEIDSNIGVFTANGHKPVAISLIPGVADNNLFYILNNQLKALAIFDYESKSEHTVTVEAGNEEGSLIKNFNVSVRDVDEEIVLGEENSLGASGGVTAYPNPVIGNQFYLQTVRDDVFVSTLELINAQGEKEEIVVNSFLCRETPYVVDIDKAPGVYFIRLNVESEIGLIKLLKIR